METENQKKARCYDFLRGKWAKSEPLIYKGQKFFVGKEGGSVGLNSFRIETEAVFNSPETSGYTLGRNAFLIADNDNDVSDWEISKELLLKENG